MNIRKSMIALVVFVLPRLLVAEEPNVVVATKWWPELTNVVTPVAWRDHPHRFIIMYDGTLIALPFPQKLMEKFKAAGINVHDPRFGAW